MIDEDQLRKTYYYNQETGQVFRHFQKTSRIIDYTHYDHNGYPSMRVSFQGESMPLSHLIFFLMTFRWPKEQIDHINHNSLDNRWINLRECTMHENRFNYPLQKGRRVKGVYLRKDGIYEASIRFNGKLHYLGRFKTEREGALAYNEAAMEYFGNFANLNQMEKEV